MFANDMCKIIAEIINKLEQYAYFMFCRIAYLIISNLKFSILYNSEFQKVQLNLNQGTCYFMFLL